MKLKESVKLKEIATILNAKFIGDPEMMVSGINEIHKVTAGDISFVDIEKYYNVSLNSNATFIIINKEVECPEGKALIISDNPFLDYKKLVLMFKENEEIPNIDFYLGKNSIIGEGTQIYPQAYISNNVIIGKDCIIHPNVVIHAGTIIGDRVVIKANSVIGGDAFYYKGSKEAWEKWPSCGRVIIHDDVNIGSGVTIDKGVSGDTIIGKQTKIDNLCQIAHGVEIGERCLFAAQVGIAGKTIIEDDVIMWGKVGVTKAIRVGSKAIILSRSVVTKSIKGNKTYWGNPAREAKYIYKEKIALKKLPDWMDKIDQLIRKSGIIKD